MGREPFLYRLPAWPEVLNLGNLARILDTLAKVNFVTTFCRMFGCYYTQMITM